jgi:diguanylate cyclase (GGDEF)-like protein
MREEQQKKPLILIGDNDRRNRSQLSDILQGEGYEIREASNGQECLGLFDRHKPDVLIIEAAMPIIDGFECCTRITKLYPNDRTPIIMISASRDEASIERAFVAGVADYAIAPLDPIVLKQRIRRLLEQARLYQELEAANRRLERLAFLDDLTQVANRRRFDEVLDREWRRMSREQLPLSILFCDLDCFKSYNDTYGHQAGDLCLREVARAIRSAAKRPADLVARYGGEEFAIILPNTRAEGAVCVAEEMRRKVAQLAIEHRNSSVAPPFENKLPTVSLSIGVTCIVPQTDWQPEIALKAADAALYQAKTEGRNCTVLNSLLTQGKLQLESAAITSNSLDFTTNLANRQYFEQSLAQEWLRMRRAQLPLSLLLCEIDYFSDYRATRDETIVQQCLDTIARAIRNAARRPGDLVARYGEEEFIAILPNTKTEGAIYVAEKMRSHVKELHIFQKIENSGKELTLSVGTSTITPRNETSPVDLIDAADTALAKAKAQGRDRVISRLI